MKAKLRYILLLVPLALAVSIAVASDKQSFSADSTSFGVRMFLVPNGDDFARMWARPETPSISAFTQVRVNQAFSAVLLYWGGTPNSKGFCDIDFEVRVSGADSVPANGHKTALCSGHEPPDVGVLALGDSVADLMATGEPVHLVVHAKITDNISGEVVTVSAPIEVVK